MGRRPGPSLDRAQVVEAAIRVIESEGPEALGVSRVARELGIKPPSLYNHIGKGDALSRAVVIEGNARFGTHLEDAVRGTVAPREQLLVLARASRDWVRANAGLYAVMSQVPPENDHPEFARIAQRIYDLFTRPLAQIGLPDDASIHALRALRSAIHGFLHLETRGQFALPEAPDDSFVWLVEALLDGIETRHSTP